MSRSIQNVAIPKTLAADLAAKAGAVSLSLNKFVELALTAFLRTGCNLTPIFSRPDPVPMPADVASGIIAGAISTVARSVARKKKPARRRRRK